MQSLWLGSFSINNWWFEECIERRYLQSHAIRNTNSVATLKTMGFQRQIGPPLISKCCWWFTFFGFFAKECLIKLLGIVCVPTFHACSRCWKIVRERKRGNICLLSVCTTRWYLMTARIKRLFPRGQHEPLLNSVQTGISVFQKVSLNNATPPGECPTPGPTGESHLP